MDANDIVHLILIVAWLVGIWLVGSGVREWRGVR